MMMVIRENKTTVDLHVMSNIKSAYEKLRTLSYKLMQHKLLKFIELLVLKSFFVFEHFKSTPCYVQ